MTDFDAREFLGAFLSEAAEHLTIATRRLLEVESALAQGRHDRRAVREVYRALHTIKGLAAMVGVEPIVVLSHAMEAVLRAADDSGGKLDGGRIELLLSGLRAVEERMKALASDRPVAPAPPEVVEALLEAELHDTPELSQEAPLQIGDELSDKLQLAERESLFEARKTGRLGYRVDFVPSPEKNKKGLNITAVRERIAAIADIVRVVPLSRPESSNVPAGLVFALLLVSDADAATIASAAQLEPADVHPLWGGLPQETTDLEAKEPLEELPAPERTTTYVRVEVKRLDDALEKLSAVVVNRYRLLHAVSELAARGVDIRSLGEILASGGRQLRELRGAIMRARMVSVAELLERVPLIVRSMSRATGKSVALEMDVGRAEVDKAVAERIFPAIMHLIRNAVDHGIEPPQERLRAGKPESGLLRIICRERGNARLELTIEDDGRGIDRDALAARLGQPVPEGDAALLDVLRTPGLSTLAQASHTSGRGMGMDIVDRILTEQLGGTISMKTERGHGTRFVVTIPLSISIVDAFTLSCSNRTFAVPVATIEEILEVDLTNVTIAPGHALADRMINHRGEAVPIVDLGLVLQFDQERDRKKALVVRRSDQLCAFAVDRMIGRQEVVIRPLEDPLVRVTGISGATDLGDGRPTLVLDLLALSGDLGRRKELAS